MKLLAITLILLSIIHESTSSAAGTETLIGVVGKDFVLLGADSSSSQSISLTASNLDKIAVLFDPKTNKDGAIAVAAAGDAADADRLIGELTAVAAIHEYQAGVGRDCELVRLDDGPPSPPPPMGLSIDACAQLARHQIATRLRSRTPLKVCLLMAGLSDVDVPDDSYTSQLVQRQVVSSVASPSATARTAGLDSAQATYRPRLYWVDEYGSLQSVPYATHGFASNFINSILDHGFRPDMTREEALDLIKDCFAQLRVRYVINSPQPPCIKCIDATGCRLLE